MRRERGTAMASPASSPDWSSVGCSTTRTDSLGFIRTLLCACVVDSHRLHDCIGLLHCLMCSKAKEAKKDLRKGRDKLKHHCGVNSRWPGTSRVLSKYFSNEEVVSHVTCFMENAPEGDPAQYLIAELLIRAAKKNGMDFHELLDIPQGDRRKYHDDVSVMLNVEGKNKKENIRKKRL
ncbi:PP2Cc [Musa troglodytarum]|uniref:protein-serine/threonine phosphatase n=1 Tax=Musa troglodytarum TaxID=320322 RepID=A0A9E7ETI9_9LILI|nr:PP2Cc [Musa troglodytarum]